MLLIQRFLKYSSVNAVLLPLNLTTAWTLTAMGIHYLLATIVGFGVQIFLAFFINRNWTFKRPDIRAGTGLLKASLVEISAILVVLVTTWFWVETVGLEFLTARVIAVGVVGVWCFLLDSLFTFQVRLRD